MMKKELSISEDKECTLTEQEKRQNIQWRTQDKTRLEGNQRNSTQIFKETAIQTLSNKHGFHSFICCEEAEYGTKLKELDTNWKIDWLAKTKNNKNVIGIAARVSFFDGFTVRVDSRGYYSEYHETLKNLENKDFPIDWNCMFTIQVQATNGKPTQIHIVKTRDLIKCVEANLSWLKFFTNSKDNNGYYYLSADVLRSKGIPVSSIPI